MADIYIINSETPKDIALELQQLRLDNNYFVLKSKTAKGIIMEIETYKQNSFIYKELEERKNEMIKQKNEEIAVKAKEFEETLFNKIFEPNKLSDNEIENLCLEFYEKFVITHKRRQKSYQIPHVKIINNIEYWRSWITGFPSRGYKTIANSYLNKIDAEIGRNKYLDKYKLTETSLIPSSYIINKNNNFGGIIYYAREYDRIFYISSEKPTLSKESQEFWDWYQKSWDVLAMYYDKTSNVCYVIKKPDEWKIEDNYTKMYYRYGNKEKFFFGMIEIPKWLYTTPAEELKPEDYFLLTNADVKAEFVKKIGINRLVDLGTVVDSYENYPENEMWAKSEYKIIDMSNLKLAKVVSNIGRPLEFFEYAPYLYMKNQTTGVYHLEGLHPRCKTLYDAIKMRYNGLNIKDYDIKDIK